MEKHEEIGTVVKADVVDRVYERVGFTRQEAVRAVEFVLEEIKSALAQGNNVRIVGFGGFNLRKKNARKARNPRTGEPIVIKPRTVLTFKPSQQLLEATNRSSHDSKDS